MHACWHRLGPDQRQPSRASTDARLLAPSEPRPAPTGPQPTVTRSQGARHTAPPPAPLGLRFRALLGLGFVPPPEPQPCAHCASIAYALLPAARIPLYRHRADPESSSRSLPSGSPARLARIAPTACRHPHPSMSPPSRSRAHRPPHRAHRAPTSASRPISLLALRRPQGPDWQEPHRMHPFFAECAKKAPFLATSGRNACFSRSRWQHPRPMHPFPGAIGRFGIHGARILPPRPFFASRSPKSCMARRCCQRRPAFPRQRHAVRPNGLCALRRGPGLLAACAPPCHLACVRRGLRPLPSRPRSSPPSYTRRASPPASRPPRPAIRRAAHCGRGEPPIGLFLLPSCCPRRRIAPTDARSPAPPDPHTLAPTDARSPAPPGPRPARTEPQPRANRASPACGATCAHPRSATRRVSPCRVGPAAVLVIPAKWCGDTIAHTRKLRF